MSLATALNKLTVSEFLALPESEDQMELVDGEIVNVPRPRKDHQRMLLHLGHLFLSRTGSHGEWIADKDMIVNTPGGTEGVRCPDIAYIQESRKHIAEDEAVTAGADIAIEIISPATGEIDRITKRNEYRTSGVREYWIVDIDERAIIIHYFAWDRFEYLEGDDAFKSMVLQELGIPCEFTTADVFEILD
jgi:Uma2 family endonuclease